MNQLIPILLILLFSTQVLAETSTSWFSDPKENQVATLGHRYYVPRIYCGHACARRCKKASRPKICRRACKSCCKRCRCVPPGTYGKKKTCPCYASLTTHGNRPKCP